MKISSSKVLVTNHSCNVTNYLFVAVETVVLVVTAEVTDSSKVASVRLKINEISELLFWIDRLPD